MRTRFPPHTHISTRAHTHTRFHTRTHAHTYTQHTHALLCSAATLPPPFAARAHVQVLRLGPPITSLSLSPCLDMLATTHINRRGIYLWSNQAVFSDPSHFVHSSKPLDVTLPSGAGRVSAWCACSGMPLLCAMYSVLCMRWCPPPALDAAHARGTRIGACRPQRGMTGCGGHKRGKAAKTCRCGSRLR